MMLLAACSVVAAQGVSERNTGAAVTPPNPLFERMGKDPAVYSRSVTGRIVTLDTNSRLLVIEGADKTQLTFIVVEKVRLRAEKDTSMAGRKDLALSDYTPGQVVRVSYRVSDNKALEVRLKRART